MSSQTAPTGEKTYRLIANDDSWYIGAIKQLIVEMYAQNPPWLDFQTNAFPSNPATGVGAPSTKDGADPK